MDVEQARSETEEAFREAGVDDADLSYLTDDYINEVMQSKPIEELDSSQFEEEGVEPEAGYNYLYNAVFFGGPGSRAYGKIAYSNWSCERNWSASYTWRSRQPYGYCVRGGSGFIWKVGI